MGVKSESKQFRGSQLPGNARVNQDHGCFAGVAGASVSQRCAPNLLGRACGRTGRSFKESGIDDAADETTNFLTMTPTEQYEAQERLAEPNRQLLALCLGALAGVLSLYALRTPAACVLFTAQEADAPKSCLASRNAYTHARLFDFCSIDCSTSHVWVLSHALFIGLLFQAITVLPTHCHCGLRFLQVTWRVDFAGNVAEFQEELTNTTRSSWIWSRVQAFTGTQSASLFEWLNKHLQKKSRMLPIPASAMLALANLLHIVAILETAISIVSSLPLRFGSFECNAQDGSHLVVNAEPDYKEVELSILLSALVLLCLNLYLQLQATWRKRCHVLVSAARPIFMPTRLNVRQDGTVLCPLNEHPLLSQVVAMELVAVDGPSGPLPLRHPAAWGDDDELVNLYFQAAKKPPLSPRKKYRQRVIALTFLAILFLHGASNSCWTCINGIRLGDSGTSFDVESQLLLLGACGRHTGSGVPCRLACIALGLLLFAQLVVSLSGDKMSDLMEITLLDFRKYQENLLNDVYSEQEVRSHVWVRPAANSWQIASFASDTHSRAEWRRSQGLVHGVKVIQPEGDEWLHVHGAGLPEDEGAPSIYIEFSITGENETRSTTIRQVVPADFLPGSFFCSVNVGKRRAWTLLSVALCVLALGLVGFDIALHIRYFIAGISLENCNDILNGRCLVIEAGGTILTHTSIGVYLAAVGGLCVFLDILFLYFTLRS